MGMGCRCQLWAGLDLQWRRVMVIYKRRMSLGFMRGNIRSWG